MNELKKFGIFSLLTLDNDYKTRLDLSNSLLDSEYFERYEEEEFSYSDGIQDNSIREELCGKNPCMPTRYWGCRE